MHRLMARLRAQEGFTLIELLVVVAIIGILATLALPRVFGAIQNSKRAQNYSDLHAISTALEQSYGMRESYPTTTTDFDTYVTNSGLLKKSQQNKTNTFGKAFIYITDSTATSTEKGAFFILVDPDNPGTGIDKVAVVCGSHSEVITIGTSFAVTDNTATTGITKDDVVNNTCTAVSGGGTWDATAKTFSTAGDGKLKVITN